MDLNGFNNSIGSLAGGGTTGGGITLGAGTLTIGGNNASTTYGGAITGTGGLVKTGAGRQILTGASSFSGETKMQGGMLRLAGTNGSALYNGGSGKVAISHDGTGALGFYSILEIGAANQLGANVDLEFDVNRAYAYLSLLGNSTEVGNLSITGSRPDWAVIQNFEGVNGVDGNSYANATFTVNQTRDDTFNGYMRDSVSGTGRLEFVKKGAATLTMDGRNITHTGGTKVMEGRLVSQGASLGGASSANQLFINSNAVLEYNLTNAPGFGTGVVQKGSTITGAGTLEKTGQGALIFGGLGQVNVAMDAGSWIRLMEGDIKAHNCVQANWENNKASLYVNTNSTFWQVEGNVTVGALAGGGDIILGYSWPNFQPVMKIGYGDASSEFSGRMTEASAWGGKGVVTKIGKGTQTFSGASNVITGNLTVNDGIVNFGTRGKFTANALWVGNVAGARGRVEIGNSNVVTTLNNADRVGVVLGDNGGTGALYQSGGSLLIQSGADVDNFIIGRGANSYGYFEVSGGTNRLSEFGVGSGYGGNGMLAVTGGEITVTNYFNIGRADSVNGQVGIVNLMGGSVRALNNSYDTTSQSVTLQEKTR
jgi:autotransporter-associated beta strand protein